MSLLSLTDGVVSNGVLVLGLSFNPNMTMEMLEKCPKKIFGWFSISQNLNKSINKEIDDMISKYLDD